MSDSERSTSDPPVHEPTHAAIAKQLRDRARRRPRRSQPRSQTVPRRELTRETMAAEALTSEDVAALSERPRTRGDCVGGERPCPWVGCRFHLALDISPESGSIKINHPHRDIWDLAETCALDVADRGGSILDEVAATMNLTRERVRQIETKGLIKIKMMSPSPDELGAGHMREPSKDQMQAMRGPRRGGPR